MSTDEIVHPTFNSYWVIPGRFMAGEYPGAVEDSETKLKLRWLLSQPTHLFVDLTKENETGLLPYYGILVEEAGNLSRRVMHVRLPLQDFGTPTPEQVAEVLDTLDLALSLGKNVYLHCFGGRGRTGTVVGCYLVRHGLVGGDPLARLQELRRDTPDSGENSPETEGQKRMVIGWKKGQ